MKKVIAPRLPALLLLALFGLTVAVACEDARDDGFGEARPVKNDGMVRKPGALPEAPPKWEEAIIVVPAYDQSSKELTVVLKIKEGFHAYGPGEEVSKPVALNVTEKDGWAVDGTVRIPAGTRKDLGSLGTSIILEGDVPLKATLTPGTGSIDGVVEVQVCTDKACDRPRKHPFTIPAA